MKNSNYLQLHSNYLLSPGFISNFNASWIVTKQLLNRQPAVENSIMNADGNSINYLLQFTYSYDVLMRYWLFKSHSLRTADRTKKYNKRCVINFILVICVILLCQATSAGKIKFDPESTTEEELLPSNKKNKKDEFLFLST